MKVCKFCEGDVHDDMLTCPHCSSTSFMNKCERCGGAYEGPVCPTCREADEAAARAAREAGEAAARDAQEAREKAEAEQKANRGLGWKTALTVFVPFVGGYFLINEHVRNGFRIFAIAWCSLLALTMGYSVSAEIDAKVIGSLLCLAPIAVHLYKTRGGSLGQSSAGKRATVIAFCALLLVVLIGDVVGPTEPPSANASTASASARYGKGTVPKPYSESARDALERNNPAGAGLACSWRAL